MQNRLHLGVDFGTSASKLVLRHFEAPGGERAYLLEPGGQFRIQSAVAFRGQDVLLSSNRSDSFKSLKMRFAGEVTGRLDEHFYGTASEIPFDISAGDLVVLTVWKLISIGHLAAVSIIGSTDLKMGMTLGVPMSFLDDEQLRTAFLLVARTAYQMYRDCGPLGPDRIDSSLALELLNEARSSVSRKPPVPESNLRNWVRSETEASMLWSFYSPATRPGPFFCIDIGAGTTDASAFLLTPNYQDGQWVKNAMCLFGAHSHPFAMDAINTVSSPGDAFNEVRKGLVRAGQKAYSLILDNIFSVKQWEDSKLIILGGGSFNAGLCGALRLHPMTNFRDTSLDRLDLLVPTDLLRSDGMQVRPDDVAFTSVAYGLAQIGEAVPEAARPQEVQPVQHHAIGSLSTHDEIYGD